MRVGPRRPRTDECGRDHPQVADGAPGVRQSIFAWERGQGTVLRFPALRSIAPAIPFSSPQCKPAPVPFCAFLIQNFTSPWFLNPFVRHALLRHLGAAPETALPHPRAVRGIRFIRLSVHAFILSSSTRATPHSLPWESSQFLRGISPSAISRGIPIPSPSLAGRDRQAQWKKITYS